jgi:hypothetical protein
MLSDKYKTIFIHIPKCGGTSIESLFWTAEERIEQNLWMGFIDKFHNKFQTGGLQHLKAHQIRNLIGVDKFDTYFKFAIVRNPYNRLISQFLYMRKRPDLREFIGLHEEDSFLQYLYKTDRRIHVQWEAQNNFLYDEQGKCLVNLVVKLENISLLPSLLKKSPLLPPVKKIPKLNSSHEIAVTSLLCPEAKSYIAERYKKDFEIFNYKV